jgi:hypothetical protein
MSASQFCTTAWHAYSSILAYDAESIKQLLAFRSTLLYPCPNALKTSERLHRVLSQQNCVFVTLFQGTHVSQGCLLGQLDSGRSDRYLVPKRRFKTISRSVITRKKEKFVPSSYLQPLRRRKFCIVCHFVLCF